MQIPENILVLIEKYQLGTITPVEKQLLNEWYHSFDDSESDLPANENEDEAQIAQRIKDRLLQTIHSPTKVTEIRKSRNWPLPAAASILLVLSITAYFMFASKSPKQEIVKTTTPRTRAKNDIVPGSNKAVLTLADGTSIVLDSTADGLISNQGNTSIKKLENGLLAYTINGRPVAENDALSFNTIATPRGGQYQVTLADGTKVWLNAASSIRFPVAFAGNQRSVEITGEAYFEVAKNKRMPFKVKAGSQQVEVLGTHFNVSAYDDDAVSKTTLLEGKVRITKENLTATLLPGQQAQINKKGELKVLNDADLAEAMAWKDGLFIMKSTDIGSIMRQIARWYDVEIVYQNGLPAGRITGDIPRNMDLAKVLQVMELNGVHFDIESRKIIVKP